MEKEGVVCTASLISILHFAFHIEPGSQASDFFCAISLQTDADGNPLFHFHEIACGIVLRDEGKSRSRGIGYGLYYAFIRYARHGIRRKGDFCALFAFPGNWQ